MSPSPLSQPANPGNLEYWVGAVLIDRSLFPISLTPAGGLRKTAQSTLDARSGREEAQGLMPKSRRWSPIAASPPSR